MSEAELSGRVVWVLDREGYDARGGWARVFSTKEKAKAAVAYVKAWKAEIPLDGSDWDGSEFQDTGDSLDDNWTIKPVAIDAAD